jgi:hypothetical protein
LLILTVATSIAPNFIHDRLTYESSNGYCFVKVETIQNPGAYRLIEFDIIFDGREGDHQSFSFDEKEEKFRIMLYEKGKSVEDSFNESILTDEIVFETFIENNLYILKIKEEFIKYENWKISSVRFYNEDSPSRITNRDVYYY